jgi:hypothetical protein
LDYHRTHPSRTDSRAFTLNVDDGGLHHTLHVSTTIHIPIALQEPTNPELIHAYVRRATELVAGLRWSARSIQTLTIDLWLTPIPKLWHSSRSPVLGRAEVNSGETEFSSSTTRHIRVWRIEDWSKVLLHELLHAFNWDRLVPSVCVGQSEGLVEAVAVLLHCSMVSNESVDQCFAIEQAWMRNQLLELRRRGWTAHQTHVRAYYPLKTALLVTVDRFLAWLNSPDHTTISSMQASWPGLVHHAFVVLRRELEPFPKWTSARSSAFPEPPLSMRMVSRHLPLA